MATIITLLSIVFVLTALLLVVVILLQEGKGGGFGDALGVAGQQAFGVKASGIHRFTMVVAVVFLSSALFIHVLNKSSSGRSILEDGGLDAPSTSGLPASSEE